ncbi:protein PLASTID TRANSCRIPTIONALLY ACTIVE 7 [Ricinus communis]|uniref:protein PLASTID TRANSCRIPTIONALLY ACTIVE 7 n=1 Tax=Ricinus communis TaxID=3988 RepID=UPI00201AA35B|nr:protein PLASTID TRANSCRIPTIONALLY ACTIVE 7 [Ricinus communis]
MSISTLPFALSSLSTVNPSPGLSLSSFPNKSQIVSKLESNGGGRRVWRRRKLTKKDDMLRYQLGRVPFLEEQVRRIKEGGKVLTMDIHRLLLSEDNRFDFVNEVAAEAIEYVESNRDEYGGKKKAILHVLSNRMNDAGVRRPEAYEESDPFRPGPGYMKEEFT